MTLDSKRLREAAEAIGAADALLVCAGAGMGVDSGLPDFRGTEGFWRAYPEARRLGLSFEDLANPTWFDRDPVLAWGFYGHRLGLYRSVAPHAGYGALLRWAGSKKNGYFVFTSNVDGHFQKAGFSDERIVECHGSLTHLQCARPCCAGSWPAPEGLRLDVDVEALRLRSEPPRCLSCGGVARPNVLMFGDERWVDGRSAARQIQFRLWLRGLVRGRLAVVEIGAGTAVPTVRATAEQIARAAAAPLIRINPDGAECGAGDIPLAAGALETLLAIDEVVRERERRA